MQRRHNNIGSIAVPLSSTYGSPLLAVRHMCMAFYYKLFCL
jgi:hypothetical protein